VKANQIPSIATDDDLGRVESSGTSSYLTDRQGSTIALANAAGSVQTQYTYDPFGLTTTSGTASTNTYKYTGRQADTSGLYYLRARYYSPAQQRFINADPMGFNGGDVNVYSYVHNSPTNLTDPSGEFVPLVAMAIACGVGATVGAGLQWGLNSLAGRKSTVGELLAAAAVGCISAAAFEFVGGFVAPILAARVFVKLLPIAKPLVANAKLASLLNQLYRPGARIGTGSTADAARSEIANGLVQGAHIEKVWNYSVALSRWITNNPGAAASDVHAAESVLQDMLHALAGGLR
jgi:RHS repeat-associated protein